MRYRWWLLLIFILFISSMLMSLFLFVWYYTPQQVHGINNQIIQAPSLTSTIQHNKSNINFLFFGDVMLDRHVKENIDKQGFQYLFINMPDAEYDFWQDKDIVMANLEGAVTNAGSHYPPVMSIDFSFQPDDVSQLKDYNFNFFNIANNHISDQGVQGIQETYSNLHNLNLDYVGCMDRKVDDCSLNIKEINGVKVAFLGYSMVYGVLPEQQLLSQIKQARTQADLVVVNMHWGVEYEKTPRQNQIILAHKIIDSGADLIIGHHPHVVQNMEIYQDKMIFYSLGNFIFDQYFSQATQEGLAVGLMWQNQHWQATLFPFFSDKGQVQLMSNQRKSNFLEWFSDNFMGDSKYVSEIRDGYINL